MLNFRTINPDRDFALCEANKRDACVASFGTSRSFTGGERYRRWLKGKAEEFPEGFVLVYDGDQLVGQLEMQVPYGRTVGYMWLFYVAPHYRGRGYGILMHRYVERYFLAWGARRIDLHVAPGNLRAVRLYRRLGYRTAEIEKRRPRMLKMVKRLVAEQTPSVDERT
jgi:ribosomal protein S18 acetylase RimI-like enzyme